MSRLLIASLLVLAGCSPISLSPFRASEKSLAKRGKAAPAVAAPSLETIVGDEPSPTPAPSPEPTPDPWKQDVSARLASLGDNDTAISGKLDRIYEKLREEPEPSPVPPKPAPQPIGERPEVSGPDRIEGATNDWITVSLTTSAKEIQFVAMDRGLKVFPANKLADKVSTIVEASAPGEYRLLAYTGGQDLPSLPKIIVVSVKGAQPPPDPVPGPAPGPAPAPTPVPPPGPNIVTADKLYVVIVDDWRKRTPEMVHTMADRTIWQTLKDGGHVWEWWDVSDTDRFAKVKPQVDANGGILPCVILMQQGGSDNGKWLNGDPADMKFPANGDGWKALIRKYTGK